MKINVEKLQLLGEQWLETKIQRMKNLLKIAEPDEALYREMMLSLGYPKNKTPFLELALLLPFKEVRKLKDRALIETALLHRAGFVDWKEEVPEHFDLSLKMEKSVWDYRNIRPANYPEKRIAGIAFLLSQTLSSGLVDYFLERIEKAMTPLCTPKVAKQCVLNIMEFSGLGIQRKTEMFFNIILPFAIAYVQSEQQEMVRFLQNIFDLHPPLSKNSVTKYFCASLPEGTSYETICISTKTYFGIHFWYLHHKNGNL